MESSNEIIKGYQERFEKKMRENEIAVLEHWKSQLDKIADMRPESIASMQLHIKKMVEMMSNRIKILKKDQNG